MVSPPLAAKYTFVYRDAGVAHGGDTAEGLERALARRLRMEAGRDEFLRLHGDVELELLIHAVVKSIAFDRQSIGGARWTGETEG